MKVLITGHRGFVGSYFHKRLIDHELTLIDIVEGNEAGEFFRNNNEYFDLVIHLAATVGGRKVIDLEPSRLFNNFVLDSEMIQWALRNKPGKIVYYSSSAAYPSGLQTRYNYDPHPAHAMNTHRLVEDDINLDDARVPDPSIYGWSKLSGEQMLRYVKDELDVWIFRPFSGYSERQSLDYPFPSFMARAARRDNPFEIWGDGEQVRDWIHIDDIVEFTMAAIELSEPDVFNICTGRPTAFNEFARILTDIVGYSPDIKHLPSAPVGVQYRVGDPTKMNKIRPARITLEEGIKRALSS